MSEPIMPKPCRPHHRFAALVLSATALIGLSACAGRQGQPASSPSGGGSGSMAEALRYVETAESALNSGDRDAALAAFAAAIEENPRIARAHMGMTEIYKERQ